MAVATARAVAWATAWIMAAMKPLVTTSIPIWGHKRSTLKNTNRTNARPDNLLRITGMTIAAFGLLTITLCPVPTRAASMEVATGDPILEPGIESYLKGHYARARSLLADRARDGHGPSQYFLGLIYLHGHATRSDPAQAYAWFAAGEANGHRPSRNLRRALHRELSIGDLPRANELARRYVYRYSGIKLAPAPCFSVGANDRVRPCHQP